MGIYFNKYCKITLIAILSLLIASCSSEGEQQSSNPPASINTPKKGKKAAAQGFKNPVVPGKNESLTAASTASNLIQPTNAKEREAVVSKGRSDPFAKIDGQIVPILPGNTGVVAAKRPVPVLPTLTTLKKKPKKIAQQPRPKSPPKPRPKPKASNKKVIVSASLKKPKLTPVLPKVLPQVVPSPKLVPVLPPPPQPKLAQAVSVSGVVVIGKEPQAIIKVPDEPTSRYVQAGQRLANGLLIKRIEMNEGSEPTVILEQYGIEVAKMVGEGAVNPKSTEASTEATNSVTGPEQTTI
ncbi:MAG: hypothetical protein QNJ51_05165 [Calothrix sp. MO_167.B12]|nr:hypothetical protein [Calothrix sp. MO_167.B12]